MEVIYADGKSGADPPFGEGYGGNESALVPQDGEVTMSWEVSADAPPGVATVELTVLVGGMSSTTEKLKFTVAGLGEDCP